MKRYSILIIFSLCILIYTILNPGETTVPIEKIDIASGISYDLINEGAEKGYNIAVNVYTFNKKDQISSMILEGIGSDIAETRATRQQRSAKKFMLGLEKVLIFSSDAANQGINPIIDILFANPDMNDMGWVVVFKGKAIDLLKRKVDDFPTSADYIDGMIENSKEQNFMSSDYNVMDMYVRVNSEGRSLTLPYIDIVDNNIIMAGIAVFKKDKLVKEIPLREAQYMNMLRESKVRGIVTVKKDISHLASTYGESKRKVTCEKVNGKYKFIIDLQFQKGQVVTNTLYYDLMKNPITIKKYTNDLEEEIKRRCSEFIYKMQKEYKIDCLELGRVAAATFGRDASTDWDEVVCNSEISVNVKVKVDKFGRGEFLFKSK